MGRKRKGNGKPFGGEDGKNSFREQDDEPVNLTVNTWEDVPDSEDEFIISRDKILLEEGPAQKKQRRALEREAKLELSDEEILPVRDDESDEAESEDFQDAAEDPVLSSPLSISRNMRKGAERLESDDEGEAQDEQDEDDTGWGSSRKDYYNADTIETEADAIAEEAEVKRLQQKQLEHMTEADFGLEDVDWDAIACKDDEIQRGRALSEELPKLEITDAHGPEERRRILQLQYPEFEPLAKEYVDLQDTYRDLKLQAEKANKTWSLFPENEAAVTKIMPFHHVSIKYRTLAAYLSSLAMYFALLASGDGMSKQEGRPMPPEQLREHTVMDILVQCRDTWEKIKDLDTSIDSLQPIHETIVAEADDEVQRPELPPPNDMEAASNGDHKKRKNRKNKIQRAIETSQAEAEAQRQATIRETEASLADLSTLTHSTRIQKPSRKANAPPATEGVDEDSDIGEQTALSAQDAANKAMRKKSLRFYTSQIAQKSNKRDMAGRDAGGDTDLPYRERFKDRQARLNTAAEKRGRRPQDAHSLDEDDSDDGELRISNREAAQNGQGAEEDYYALISARAAQKKADQAALSALHAQARAEGGLVRVVEDNEMGEDGKRAISYAIEKNKGLTPRRKKDVRNPRVKKRKKYEEKKRKLGSVRPVYKGGEGRGGYGGELTGIKTSVSKGIRL